MDSVMKNPKVTVLMPVYNGEKYLSDAIDSVLCQDYTDFEFLIINDGSVDNSPKIISSYSDARIRLLNNEKNIGLVNTLNIGLESAKGEYIVRMDCDDISAKNRLSVQVAFMDNNMNVGASGSYYYRLINGKKAVMDFPLNQDELKCFMLFICPIAHPSAIIRNSIIQKEELRYRAEYIHAEDYDLWSRLSEKHDIANVSSVLLNYRVHANQITGNDLFAKQRTESVSTIRKRELEKIGIIPSVDELIIHNLISDASKPKQIEEVGLSEEWLRKLIFQNNEVKLLNKNYLEKIILERWLRVCVNYFGNLKGLKYFYNSSLYDLVKLPLKTKIEFVNNLYNSWKRLKIK